MVFKRIFASVFFAILFSGCTPAIQLSTNGFIERTPVNIIDHSGEEAVDFTPVRMALITSCHYGTMKLDNDKITPKPTEYMRKYLSHRLKKPAEIEIKKFDIFTNSKVKLVKGLEGHTSTVPGASVTFGEYNPTRDKFIGCEGEDSGGYIYNEVEPVSVPILIYINGIYNGNSFRQRHITGKNENGMYPNAKDLQKAIDEAIMLIANKFGR